MEQQQTDLSSFDNRWYKTGGNWLLRCLWFCTQALFFGSWLPGSSWRVFLLRLFGAKMGKCVVIKPGVKVKYPWRPKVGNYSWLGENVWIDNLGDVEIGANCCLSQGSMLLCGNHNYKKKSFDLMVGNIVLADGVWIGARALVCPGVEAASHSILTAQSTATQNMEAWGTYSGNPAVKVREREILG
jgi:putative colanic acid biosynthesis acetyltransferase WcaF